MTAEYAERWRKANPDKVWFGSTSCSLCYWSAQVQGGGPGDLSAALAEHQQTHPEWAELQASLPSIEEIRAAVHEHCNHRDHRCPCTCGCAAMVSCDCWSDLCSACEIRIGRDDDEHGRAQPAADAGGPPATPGEDGP